MSPVISSNGLSIPPEDLEIHIRGTESSIVNPLRRSEGDLVRRANSAVANSEEPLIAHRKFSSGRALPSGDIILQADSIDDVEQLTRRPVWCAAFGENASIKRRTFGVVMHGVDTSKINPSRKSEARARLLADNAGMIFTTKDQSSADSSVGSPVIVEFDYQCRRLEHLILYLLRAY